MEKLALVIIPARGTKLYRLRNARESNCPDAALGQTSSEYKQPEKPEKGQQLTELRYQKMN